MSDFEQVRIISGISLAAFCLAETFADNSTLDLKRPGNTRSFQEKLRELFQVSGPLCYVFLLASGGGELVIEGCHRWHVPTFTEMWHHAPGNGAQQPCWSRPNYTAECFDPSNRKYGILEQIVNTDLNEVMFLYMWIPAVCPCLVPQW